MGLRERGVISSDESAEMMWTFHQAGPMPIGVAASMSIEGSESLRFLKVERDGREFPAHHGDAVRVFIRKLRESAAGDYLIRRRDEGGEPRVSESLRLDGGREFSVEYVSKD